MVLAHGEADGRRFVLLGLEPGNVKRLKEGRPMRITAESHPGFPEDLEIVVCLGEPRAIAAILKPFLAEDAKIVAVPPNSGQGDPS